MLLKFEVPTMVPTVLQLIQKRFGPLTQRDYARRRQFVVADLHPLGTGSRYERHVRNMSETVAVSHLKN